jgi:hypothetical protein
MKSRGKNLDKAYEQAVNYLYGLKEYELPKYILHTKIKVAFVSTNSISQGEQVGILWGILITHFGVKINFAHRTFKWNNESKGNAAVHCVIIGFSCENVVSKRIFEYESVSGDPHEIKVKNINPFLTEGKDITIIKRSSPICNVPNMNYGSMPIDDGHLILSNEEKEIAIRFEPQIKPFIYRYTGGDEFINNRKRWCLWLVGVDPSLIRNSAFILERIAKTKTFRLASKRDATRKLASRPMLFGEIRQPSAMYIIVPKVSSESRMYIPIGIIEPSVICNGSALMVTGANLYIFGVLNSVMHMSWTKTVCGRMKSDYQYSAGIVYNNFPWPESPTQNQISAIEEVAQKVLNVRSDFPNSSLADLYDPLTMPHALSKAHNELDKAVDLAYRPQPFTSEPKRLEFLFGLYEKYTESLFLTEKVKKVKKGKKCEAQK